MELLIKVPVKPFVKKYISADYAVDPFLLTTSNPYGMFLFNALQKPTPRLLRNMHLEKRASRQLQQKAESAYTDVLLVQISENYWEKKGCIITPEGHHHFNRFVTYLFYDECFKYVRNGLGKSSKVKTSILEFAKIYDISEDEFAFRTVERMWHRRYERLTA